MNSKQVLSELKKHSVPKDREGMARFGIDVSKALGVRIPVLRTLAKEIGKDHDLALSLWDSGIHEARILASMIDDATQVTEAQMETWISEFNSWDLCDQVCMNLFDRHELAYELSKEWSAREREFEKRAGYALMACLAWHDKTAADIEFICFMPYIITGSEDDRNFVKKAVNWALRQIGKRNKYLKGIAVQTAKTIAKLDSRSAQWVAKDALKELESEVVKNGL